MSTTIVLRTRTGFAGVPASFTGKAFDAKGEPLDGARFMWAFGDGSSGEGSALFHTFYYPGDYTIVLDASSGRYTASARIVVSVSDPALAFRLGGDATRSFIVVENNGAGELDLSGWQIIAGGKNFTIPQNTIAASHKALTFPSEVTGLTTNVGSHVELRFPNGVAVSTQTESAPQSKEQSVMSTPAPQAERVSTYTAPAPRAMNTTPTRNSTQKASVGDALNTEGVDSALVVGADSETQDNSLMWYIAAAFFGAFALLGLRFSRNKKALETPSEADEFTITEEK